MVSEYAYILEDIKAEVEARGSVGTIYCLCIFVQNLRVDFATKAVEVNDVLSLQLNISRWSELVKLVKSRVNAAILVVFDYSFSSDMLLAVFSQNFHQDSRGSSLK